MERDLIQGLVGEKHRQQYLADAEFKAGVDLLARMLPSWVDGIAADCAATRVEREVLIQQLERTPFRAADALLWGEK